MTDIVPMFDDGHIVLRVPRAVVAASAFPARLDPTIASEKAVDSPIAGAPSGAQSLAGGVAFSGAESLACWQDFRRDTGDGEHVEIVITERVYRVRRAELRQG